MRDFKLYPQSSCFLAALLTICSLLFLESCNKDEYAYAIENQLVQAPNANKTKLKTDEQYLAILYTNLYQQPLSVSNLIKATNVIQSIGDREFAHSQIVANFMNSPSLNIPTDEEMRSDISGFIQLCYNRFYTREPSSLEMEYFLNYIESNEDIKADMVYFSFAVSNEYQFY